jgi:hypothetical protein
MQQVSSWQINPALHFKAAQLSIHLMDARSFVSSREPFSYYAPTPKSRSRQITGIHSLGSFSFSRRLSLGNLALPPNQMEDIPQNTYKAVCTQAEA